MNRTTTDDRARGPALPRLLMALLLCLAVAAQPALAGPDDPAETTGGGVLQWFELTPVVVRPDFAQGVALVVQADAGSIDGVQVRLANGSTVALNNNGGGSFSTALTHAQVLFGYAEDDYNHNFIGFLDLKNGPTVMATVNLFINVADDRVTTVPVFSLAADMQATGHVVNIRVPTLNAANPNVISATTRFYNVFPDNYDFVNVIFVPERTANRDHTVVSNSVAGIGLENINHTASYGSAGRLLGLNRYPLTSYYDLAETGSVHEFGHQWIQYLDLPALQNAGAHWPLSSLARGIMGYSGDGGQGLNFPYDLIPSGGGNYTLQLSNRPPIFNDMELYLMGMLPANQVGTHFVFNDQNQNTCAGCTLFGPVTTVTITNVVSLHGARVPSYANAPRTFRVATIIATRNRLLNTTEMSFFTYMTRRASLTTPVPYSLGLAKGTTYPFYSATRGEGCLTTRLLYTSADGCYALRLPLVRRAE